MDKTAIKNYAVQARRKLIAAVIQKAYDIGVLENEALPVTEVQGGFIYNETSYSNNELLQRKRLVDTINLRADGKGYNHGYKQVMEDVAYTWFNRLIALRFMEVNEYLPSNVRILSSVNEDRLEPDCIREVQQLDFVDMSKIAEYNDDEKLYKYILISQCNALSKIMPKMFEAISDYTELLLPDKLYTKDGIVYDLVHDIHPDNFKEAVEIIGWLYQYYISEKKDEVFANLKKNIKITKENIPAATQLFTPDWIVKYMVENSLGRLVVEKLNINPKEMGWKYYLPEAEQTEEVKQQIAVINASDKDFDIKSVKVIDPCMGSGHILVYAFDVLYQIYESLGYATREIPNLILENNIFGLDIDNRAGQLAYFALMMKARNYNRRFFRQVDIPQPKVYSLIDSENWSVKNEDLQYIIEIFRNAKEYGSILKIDKDIDYDRLMNELDSLEPNFEFDLSHIEKTKEIINIAKILTKKYDVVITNPPYMGSSGMSAKLSEYVKKNFADSKSDLFAVFIEQCGQMAKQNGYQSMITQHAWMFLSSYEKLRGKLIQNNDMVNMAHLGARAFEEIGGEVVQTTAFVLRNSNTKHHKSTFIRLVDFNSQQAKEDAFLIGENSHIAQQENFERIPGAPIAYWVSENIFNIFNNCKCFSELVHGFQGIITGNNNYFLKFWYEISNANFYKSIKNIEIMSKYDKGWIPYKKGGGYCKWFGNSEYALRWENDGKGLTRARTENRKYYLKEGVTWSYFSTSEFSANYFDIGYLWDVHGSSIFTENHNLLIGLLAFMNSNVAKLILNTVNPTLSFQVENILALPYIPTESKQSDICKLAEQNIHISKSDWNSFETSWDFKRHPLLKVKMNAWWGEENDNPRQYKIEDSFKLWDSYTETMFNQLKANEEELNRIFIEIYGLQDELTPDVAEKDVTIRKADLARDVKSFISYAVGCMFGRYSLDVDGLVYAGGDWNKKYITTRQNNIKSTFTLPMVFSTRNITHVRIDDNDIPLTYIPDDDNIIAITDNDYFEDDIVIRFIEFVKTVYGEETLDQNLEFIANAIYPNGNGTAREKIRKYFLNDFYKDHIKTYQKKPIYWQFDSGKQGGFKALIYLHRYDKYTAARVRTDYLHPLQRKYEAEIKRLEMLSELADTTPREVAEYKKQIIDLGKKIDECRAYDQAIAHIAHQAIELDLDDGVTVNYAKFQDIEVPQGDGKSVLKMDLLSKI